MAEQKLQELLAPIRKYKCLICKQTIEMTLEDAKIHANTPVAARLPLGWVFKTNRVQTKKKIYMTYSPT